jgi:hypothetical protein
MLTINTETISDVPEIEKAESDGTVERAVERAVETLIFHLYKAFSAMRMYEENHPALNGSLKQLFQNFTEFLDTHGEFHIHLTESDIIFNDLSVYHEEKRRGGLIFMLFNDGIREMKFEPGLTYDEIAELLTALKTNSRLIQEERDIVSLFWSKGFSHIHYLAVEEIPDEEIESVANAIADLESPRRSRDFSDSSSMDEASSFWNHELEEWRSKKSTTNLPTTSQLKAANQETIEALLQSVEGEHHFEPDTELIQIIFDVLYLENEDDRFLLSLKLLEEYSNELLVKGNFAQVNLIVEKLKTYLERQGTCMSLRRQHTEALLAKFSHEEKLGLLRRGLKEIPIDQQDELRHYITLLNPTAIGSMCSFLGEIEDVKTLRTLCGGLAVLATGHTSRLARPLENGPTKVARDIVTILQHIGDDSAIALLKACVNHGQAIVREEAVRALRTLDHPRATEALMQFLTDEDPAIRTVTAEGLESCDKCGSIEPLLDMVHQKTFNKRSYREKKAVLGVLGKVECTESIDTLEGILSKRCLFGRKKQDESRVCAALALAKLKSEKARRLLERFSRDSSTPVKKACQQAMLTLQTRR